MYSRSMFPVTTLTFIQFCFRYIKPLAFLRGYITVGVCTLYILTTAKLIVAQFMLKGHSSSAVQWALCVDSFIARTTLG